MNKFIYITIILLMAGVVYAGETLVDISSNTNLVGGTGITLTDDTLSCDLGTATSTPPIPAEIIAAYNIGQNEMKHAIIKAISKTGEAKIPFKVSFTSEDGETTKVEDRVIILMQKLNAE